MDGKDIEVVGKVSAQFERVERFQPLQAGQYWKAMLDIAHEGIAVGQVLLIESIKWVDNKAHTIVLRSHPSVYGKYDELPSPESKDCRWGMRLLIVQGKGNTNDQ